MDYYVNKREMSPALFRAGFGFIVMYLVFIGSVGYPMLRFELAIGTLLAASVLVILSLLVPERWAAGNVIFFIIDVVVVAAGIVYFGGINGWVLFLTPLLVISAVYRFSSRVSLVVR